MRIVGNTQGGLQTAPQTPEEAWRRGRALDAMLPNPLPLLRGVMRMTHAKFNELDDKRMLALARRLNPPQEPHA